MKADNSSESASELGSDDENLRDMQCEMNILSRPDGSVVYSQGNTVVFAAIYGPVDNKIPSSDAHNANVEVSFNAKSGLPTIRERLRETTIKQICDVAINIAMHPRTLISVNIQEMQDFGGLLSCSINACCLALVCSGLPMQYLFAAVNCAITNEGLVIIDPTSRQVEDVEAQLTFVFDSVSSNVISCTTSGKFSVSQYKDCLTKCEKSSENIFKYYRDIVKKYSQKFI